LNGSLKISLQNPNPQSQLTPRGPSHSFLDKKRCFFLPITEKKAIGILRKYRTSDRAFRNILLHSKKVKEIALDLSKNIKGIDKNFIATSALLHDIGRYRFTPRKKGIRHAVEGAKLLRKEGLHRHAKLVERHTGSGITKNEAIKLGLPAKEYVPKTREEKIVCFADSLTYGSKRKTYAWVLRRYRREVGEVVVKRTERLYKDIMGMK